MDAFGFGQRVGKTGTASPKGGLGTSLVAALAHQLGTQVDMASSPSGMRVSVAHVTFKAVHPQAAFA